MVDLTLEDLDQGAEPERPRSRRRRTVLRVLLGASLALLVALVAGGLWLRARLDPPGPPGAEVSVDIPLGSSTADIARILEDADVVADATVFRLYVRFRGTSADFQAGAYDMRERSSVGEAVEVLVRGPRLPPAVRLTVPEGLTVAEIAKRIDRVEHLDPARFLELATNGSIQSVWQPPGAAGTRSLEGLLFPETYRIETSADEAAVLRQMLATFDDVAARVGLGASFTKVGVYPYEALIVASLVEAEAKSDTDRPKIARVIYNRLAAGMPLGIDATFYYVLGPERKGTSLRQSDLQADHPYNLRLRTGLPPTPIMAPGEASLRAALEPEQGPWLYYVLADSRNHAFSASYEEFLRNKAAAQRAGLIP
jgi:UPF0755 protein